MSIPLNLHAEAILTRLGTITIGTPPAPLKVGDGVAPKSANGSVVAPCAVLHGRDGGALLSSIGCLDTDGAIPFQVTAVGRSQTEARVVADKCSAALTATALPVTGYSARVRRNTASSNTQRDDDVSPSLFYVTTIYRLLTYSAA